MAEMSILTRLRRFFGHRTPAQKAAAGHGSSPAAGRLPTRYLSKRHLQAMQMASDVHDRFDSLAANLGTTSTIKNQKKQIACAAGCSHCCSLYVSATASELLLIEGYIAAQPADVQKAIQQRFAAAVPRARGKSMVQRATQRITCPMLDESGRCRVYPVRPLTCRAYVSFDVAQCKADEERPAKGVRVHRSQSLSDLRDELLGELFDEERTRQLHAGHFEIIQALGQLLGSTSATESLANGGNPILQARSRER